MSKVINKYNLNSLLKYEFFKTNTSIQNIICNKLLLIDIRSKAQNKTVDILNNIEKNIIDNNEMLKSYKSASLEDDYMSRLRIFKYYMYCLIYDIRTIYYMISNL